MPPRGSYLVSSLLVDFAYQSHLKPLNSAAQAIMSFFWLLPLLATLVHAKTFKAFHNTFDPAVFGTTGGAHHNATADGYVDASSICIRLQVCQHQWSVLHRPLQTGNYE